MRARLLFSLATLLAACSPGAGRSAVPPSAAGAGGSASPAKPVEAPGAFAAGAPGSLPRTLSPGSGPLTLEAAAGDASWIVSCQARADTDASSALETRVLSDGSLAGDRLSRYLTFADGQELTIEDLLAVSADDRWLVIVTQQGPELLDARSATRVPLPAELDGAREPGPSLAHPAIVFGGDALYFVWRRDTPAESRLVERRLAGGAERVLYSDPAPILRLALDATGGRILIDVPGLDTNGNGRFDGRARRRAAPSSCHAPIVRFPAPIAGADRPSVVIVDPKRATARRVDDLALLFGEAVVHRKPDGALELERAGQRLPLGPPGCAGSILWADPTRDLLLFGCPPRDKPTRLAVGILDGGRYAPLGIEVAALEGGEAAPATARLVPLYPGADSVLFDAQKKRLVRLEPGDAVLGTHGELALVRRGRSALIVDAETDAEQPLPGELDPLGALLRQGPLVFATPLLVDLGARRVLGTFPGRPLALSRSGALLVAARAASASRLAEGPLYWRTLE